MVACLCLGFLHLLGFPGGQELAQSSRWVMMLPKSKRKAPPPGPPALQPGPNWFLADFVPVSLPLALPGCAITALQPLGLPLPVHPLSGCQAYCGLEREARSRVAQLT